MGGPSECAQSYVKTEILAYLERMPQASDTVDGIIDWWLYDQRLHTGRETVLAALADLVEAGVLEQRRILPDTILYAKLSAHPSTTDKD